MSREMKHSGIPWIGVIPKDWGISSLKYFVDCLDGKRIPLDSASRVKGEYPYWGAGNIVDFVNDYIFDEELVLLGEDGAPFFDKTRSVAFLVKGKIWVNNHIHVLRVHQNINAQYIVHFLNIVEYKCYINGSIIAKLTQANMNTIPLLLPSFSEQQKIAEFLDKKCGEVDEMIALQEQIIEELKAYKQSVITEAVTKGLNPNVPMKDSGIEWIGEIPEHWCIDKVIRSFGLIGSGTTPKSTEDDNFVGNIRWIQSGDINGGIMFECKNRISESTLKKTSALKVYNPPFIIVAMYGASVGNTSISTIDGCVNQACCVLSDTHLNLDYTFNVIKTCKDYWLKKAVGGGQPNISQDTIKSTWIPIPPTNEQQSIADYLDKKCGEIDALIAIKQQKIESLKEYKKSIIYEYVTGKKEVV